MTDTTEVPTTALCALLAAYTTLSARHPETPREADAMAGGDIAADQLRELLPACT